MVPAPAPPTGKPRLMGTCGSASAGRTPHCRRGPPPPPFPVLLPGVESSRSALGVESTGCATGPSTRPSPLRLCPQIPRPPAPGRQPRCRPLPSLPSADALDHTRGALPPPPPRVTTTATRPPPTTAAAAVTAMWRGRASAAAASPLLGWRLGGRQTQSRSSGEERAGGRWGGGQTQSGGAGHSVSHRMATSGVAEATAGGSVLFLCRWHPHWRRWNQLSPTPPPHFPSRPPPLKDGWRPRHPLPPPPRCQRGRLPSAAVDHAR